jgi:hypothetical protein
MDTFIESVVRYLELKKPYRVILQSSMRKNAAAYTAHYTSGGKLLRHILKINLENLPHDERDLHCLIAHEFIHAWQEEKGHTDIHGNSFQRMANMMGTDLGIDFLYLPDVDTP